MSDVKEGEGHTSLMCDVPPWTWLKAEFADCSRVSGAWRSVLRLTSCRHLESCVGVTQAVLERPVGCDCHIRSVAGGCQLDLHSSCARNCLRDFKKPVPSTRSSSDQQDLELHAICITHSSKQ